MAFRDRADAGVEEREIDDVRRRVQQAQTGHRGRTDDPLYGIRRVLHRRTDHLSTKAWARLEAGLIAGDPDGDGRPQ